MSSLFNVGSMLELSEAIRDYHDSVGLPQMVSYAMFSLEFWMKHIFGNGFN